MVVSELITIIDKYKTLKYKLSEMHKYLENAKLPNKKEGYTNYSELDIELMEVQIEYLEYELKKLDELNITSYNLGE